MRRSRSSRSFSFAVFIALTLLVWLAPGAAATLRDWIVGLAKSQVSVPTVTLPALPTSLPGLPRPSVTVPDSTNLPALAVSALSALADIPTLPQRPTVPACRTRGSFDRVCAFGQAWSDSYVGPGGHNGCDTRNDILAAQMTSVTFKPGSRCIVVSGMLADPYTGKTIAWTKANASAAQVDHVVPLARAWDLGASTWPMSKRVAFANDEQVNLLLVDGPTNQSKSDQGPAEWMPANKGYACAYAIRYVSVTSSYGLRLTAPEKESLDYTIRQSCAS